MFKTRGRFETAVYSGIRTKITTTRPYGTDKTNRPADHVYAGRGAERFRCVSYTRMVNPVHVRHENSHRERVGGRYAPNARAVQRPFENGQRFYRIRHWTRVINNHDCDANDFDYINFYIIFYESRRIRRRFIRVRRSSSALPKRKLCDISS